LTEQERTAAVTMKWREDVIGRLSRLETSQETIGHELHDIKEEQRRLGRAAASMSAADRQEERDSDNTRASRHLQVASLSLLVALASVAVAAAALFGG
jgi:hypothetical protein